MVDTSKLPISRVDELIDKLNEIDTNLSNLNNNITLINSKLDSMKYITETWSEGTEWYRVWSDGWIEQGGMSQCTSSKTISLLKNMKNTAYNINIQERNSVGYQSYWVCSSITTSSFTIHTSYTGETGIIWSVKGQSA